MGHGPGRMLAHQGLQQGVAPHSYLFAPFIQDLHKLGWKPACEGKQPCEEQQLQLFQPSSPRSKSKGLPKPPRTLKPPGVRRRPRGKRRDWLGHGLIMLHTEALTSQAVQLTHPAVLILLRNDLQERTNGTGLRACTKQVSSAHARLRQSMLSSIRSPWGRWGVGSWKHVC